MEDDVDMNPDYQQDEEDDGWGNYGVEEDSDYYGTAAMPDLKRNISKDGGPKLTRGFSFTLIENQEIEGKQQALIEKVEDTMAVSKGMARAMLLKTQWNVEQLEQKYFDNPERVIKELFNLDWVEVDDRLKGNKAAGIFSCLVCCEETSNPIILECAHGLCRDCYQQYLLA